MSLITDAEQRVFADLRIEANAPKEWPAVVTLHGWGRSRSDLDLVVEGYTRLAVDLPGFGSSPPPPTRCGSAWYADVVADLIEAADLERPILLGHSFGGRVGAVLASSRPDLVAGVVFVGVPLIRIEGPKKPSLGYRSLRWANRRGLISDDAMEARRRRTGSADYRAAEGVMREVLVEVVAESYEAELTQIGAPVGFCWGESDSAAPLGLARQAWELVPNAVVFDVVAGAGHDVHLSHPDAVRKVVRQVADALGEG